MSYIFGFHSFTVLETNIIIVYRMSTVFECKKCDYICNSQSLWRQHLNTRKHNKEEIEPAKNVCACGSSYKTRSGLWKHEKKCTSPKPETAIDYMSMISQLMNQNNELKNFIIEQSIEHKKDTTEIVNKVIEQTNKVIENNKPTVINQTNNQNNNQKFNINVFLNEQCKDAMNFSDFIKGIEVSREDLENNAQLGFVNGISKIILDNLRQLSINERPIHCTDLKREIMYIKDDDKWTKETGPAKLNTAILSISQKSTRTLLDWKKENPDYQNHDSEFSTRCIVIQRNSMAGFDRDTYYPKVIRAIAKVVTI